MKRSLYFLLICTLSWSTASCIGGGGALTAAAAPQVASTFSTLIAQLPRGNNTGTLPADLTGGGVTTNSIELRNPRLSCETVSPASPDADSDGVSLLKEYSFDCTDVLDGAGSVIRKGSFKSVDKDDSVAGIKGGFRFEFDIPTWLFKTTATGLTAGGSYNGFWDMTGTDNSSRFLSDYSGRYYGEYDMSSHGLGQVKVDYLFSHQFDVNYTHDNVASGSDWNSGTMNGTGTYTFKGQFLSEDANGKHEMRNGSAEMTWKTEGVTFDGTCTKWYKTGSFYLTDTGGNIIKTVFSCTAVKVYFNGEELKDFNW